MKRLSIAIGIPAIAIFIIIYQFIFADHRSRLSVGTDSDEPLELHESNYTDKLNVLQQEASFNDGVAEESFSIVEETAYYAPKAVRTAQVATRKLIKNADLDFQVNDIDSAKKFIDGYIKLAGGYIASDNQSNYSGGPQYEEVIRIPVDNLDGFITKVVGVARKVKSKNISTKDVTDDFIDTEARLTTKKELEKHYRDLLHKARTVVESLQVEVQLETVRSDIESMEGRLQYLRSQVAFSTLSLTYYQVIPVTNNTGFGQRLANSLGNGWHSLLEFIVGLLVAWPLLIFGTIAAWFIFRWIRKEKFFLQPASKQ